MFGHSDSFNREWHSEHLGPLGTLKSFSNILKTGNTEI